MRHKGPYLLTITLLLLFNFGNCYTLRMIQGVRRGVAQSGVIFDSAFDHTRLVINSFYLKTQVIFYEHAISSIPCSLASMYDLLSFFTFYHDVMSNLFQKLSISFLCCIAWYT